MAPRRSVRSKSAPYKKGDYVEYQYKGQTVTGKLFKKVSGSKELAWIVTPSDRRRNKEEMPERALGNVISAQEAMANRAPKIKHKGNGNGSSQTSTSDGSGDDEAAASGGRRGGSGGRGSSSSEGSKADNDGSSASRKRKSDDSGSDEKGRRAVTFSQEADAAGGNATKAKGGGKKTAAGRAERVGTRSTRGAGQEPLLLPELPARKRNLFKKKRIKKDENVTVVKMLTGTLYLYRGERPRAEFVRQK
ncbi:hypothetical protein ACHAXT_004987 [Thalassiosira profunda]